MDNAVNQSQFFMWRTLFAVAHADNVLTDEEIAFMANILEDVNFTSAQTSILKDDIINPKDVEEMFKSITDKDDRLKFFDFARDLVWVDGDFASEEQEVMIKLLEKHVKDTDVDILVGSVSLEFEEDLARKTNNYDDSNKSKGALINMLTSFRSRFS